MRDDDHVPFERTFFTERLPGIEDLAELKVVLHVHDLATTRSGSRVPLDDLLTPVITRSIAGTGSPERATERVRRALQRAVVNGHLLQITTGRGAERRTFVLPATGANRASLLGAADADRDDGRGPGEDPSIFRPNVYATYEQHIGPLTPLVAEQLREAERAYPRVWIEQAINEAVFYNKRNWRYIQSILASWEVGGPDGVARRHP